MSQNTLTTFDTSAYMVHVKNEETKNANINGPTGMIITASGISVIVGWGLHLWNHLRSNGYAVTAMKIE
ncbi:hypothetical protein QQ045_020457 [Rhodiola kirilowii]